MFRDDHEAALARIAALETELDDAQADDAEREAKVAKLERELVRARLKLEQAESELAQHRPRPAPSPRPVVARRVGVPTDPPAEVGAKPGTGRAAAIVVAVLLVLIVVGGIVAIVMTN